jgi:tRNA A-37 threonylcarbamoyl transferase component Bud32/tetratricopeptide (TPR) repeat protein
MDTTQVCSICGKPVVPEAPQGLCPECLMKSGFETKAGNEPAAGKTAFVPPSVEQMAKLFPQLEIIELLGQGGMGAVYKARQPRLNRFVALKILSPEKQKDPQFAERFEREARALAWLNHPNIVTIYDFGETQGNYYLLMEFVDGMTLRALLQARRLASAEALAIVPQICQALQYAHEQGIIHRDIKPENILLDKKGQVKIADFGIAKLLDQTPQDISLTGAKDVVGTPHYMAPEQIEKPQTVDHRADIYSLGVVFYEMLTGELPLGNFQPPSQKVQIDVRLDEVVLHAMEKEPERRYQKASQVKTAVETIASTTASAPDAEIFAREILAGDYTLDIGSCLRRGWTLVRSNFWPVVGVTALILLLRSAALCALIGVVVSGPLMGGLCLYFLKKIRGESAGVGTAFSGFSSAFLPLFLASFVMTALTAAGFFCLLLPGVYLVVAWTFTLALVIDKRLGFGPAMRLSRKTVSKHWWKLFGFIIVLSLVKMAGMLVFFVGSLVTAPVALAALMYAYEDIFGATRKPADLPSPIPPVAATVTSGGWKKAVVVGGLGLVALVLLLFVGALLLGTRPKTGELPRKGLVALWSGEDNGNDSVGSNAAILTDMTFAEGVVGRAFCLNGSSSCAKVPFNSALDMENRDGLTISAWIKPANVDDFHPIVEWNSTAVPPLGIGCQLRLGRNPKSQGQLTAIIVDMNGHYHSLESPMGAVVNDRFQHVAATYDKASGAGILYLDGRVVAQAKWESFAPKTKGDLWISRRPTDKPNNWTYNKFFAGLLDEIAIYNRALTAGEIQTYYNAVRTNANLQSNQPSGYEASHLGGVRTGKNLQSNQPTPTIAATESINSNALGNLLNEDQRLVVQWTDRKFQGFFDQRTFDGWSNNERADLERRSIDTLKGPRSDEYYKAINTLAALRSTNALPVLRDFAFERRKKDNRDRWMSVRALGLLGDKQSVPELIHLLYHYNVDTRWWAQISLVRLTGQNFGKDWKAWGNWWNSQNGQPPFNPEIIRWSNDQAEPDQLAESLAESDRKFLKNIGGKSSEVGSPTIDDAFWQNLDRKNYQHYREELQKAPEMLTVRPTHYNLNRLSHTGIGAHYGWIDGKLANLCVSFSELVSYAYTKKAVWDPHLMTRTEFPQEWHNGQITNQFDVIDTLRVQPVERLQAEIKQQLKEQFGLAWHRETRDTDVLLIKVKDPQLLELKISRVFASSRSIPELAGDWENYFGKPVLDETGLTNRYDKRLDLIPAAYVPNRTKELAANNAFLAQYGLELVPSHRPMEWLALERTPTAIIKQTRLPFQQLPVDIATAMNASDFGRAQSLAGEATQLNPQFAEAWVADGMASSRLEQFDRAQHAYERALSLYQDKSRENPSDANSVLQQIFLLTLLDRSAEAETLLESARKSYPADDQLTALAQHFSEVKSGWTDWMIKTE